MSPGVSVVRWEAGKSSSPFGRGRLKPSEGYVVRTVCIPCNTGWMHRLEDEVEPILGPMIAGERASLNGAQTRLIALWVGKTFMTLQQTRPPAHHGIPGAHYRFLYRRREPPPTMRLWLSHFADALAVPSSIRAQGLFWQFSGQPRPVRPNAYTLTFHFGHLVAQTFGHILPVRLVEIAPDAFTKCRVALWPEVENVKWPSASLRLAQIGEFGMAFEALRA
jgi:hypothetical protein